MVLRRFCTLVRPAAHRDKKSPRQRQCLQASVVRGAGTSPSAALGDVPIVRLACCSPRIRRRSGSVACTMVSSPSPAVVVWQWFKYSLLQRGLPADVQTAFVLQFGASAPDRSIRPTAPTAATGRDLAPPAGSTCLPSVADSIAGLRPLGHGLPGLRL